MWKTTQGEELDAFGAGESWAERHSPDFLNQIRELLLRGQLDALGEYASSFRFPSGV